MKLYKENGRIVVGTDNYSTEDIKFNYFSTDTIVDILTSEPRSLYRGLVTGLENSSGVAYTTRAEIEYALTQSPAPLTGINKTVNIQLRFQRPADTASYAINDAINTTTDQAQAASQTLGAVAMYPGGSAWINHVNVTTNNVDLAGKTIRMWFYRGTPEGLVGDNAQLVLGDTNTTKGRWYADVTFNSFITGDGVVVGQADIYRQVTCSPSSRDLKMRVQTLSACTTISAAFFDFDFTITQQA